MHLLQLLQLPSLFITRQISPNIITLLDAPEGNGLCWSFYLDHSYTLGFFVPPDAGCGSCMQQGYQPSQKEGCNPYSTCKGSHLQLYGCRTRDTRLGKALYLIKISAASTGPDGSDSLPLELASIWRQIQLTELEIFKELSPF